MFRSLFSSPMRAVSLSLAIIIVFGCGKAPHGTATYPAKGKLLVHGKPGAGILVMLRPVTPLLDFGDVMPSGMAEEDGSFSLTTRKVDDGAPAGEYIVTLATPPAITRGFGDVKPPVFINRKYSDPKTSPLRASIKPAGSGEVTQIPIAVP